MIGKNIYHMGDDSFTYTAIVSGVPERAYAKLITAEPRITYVMGEESTTVFGTPLSVCVNDLLDAD